MKKLSFYLLALTLFLAGSLVWTIRSQAQLASDSIPPTVLGDEDDEDEDDEDDDDDNNNDNGSAGNSSSSTKTKTVTTYVKLPDQIIKKTIEETIYDSDGDGVFDPEDPTPNLHDVFLVKDENRNGIVDEYERK